MSTDALSVDGRESILLSVEHLTMRFGGLTAVDDVSFWASRQHITAIIGPNGAGKTTVFNCLTGFYKPSVGRLTLNHPRRGSFYLERLVSHHIPSRAGVARTFQNIRLFGEMSVLENLIVAQHNKLMIESRFTVGGLLGSRRYRTAERTAVDLAAYWLGQVGLLDRADVKASSLPYGDQRRLEIARAMCTGPVLLCLDEPAAGLNPRETADLRLLLHLIRDEHDVGVLLIEHDMGLVMSVSDHIIVLDYGRVIADGTPSEVSADPAVIRAYLGEEEDVELPSEVETDVHLGLPST